MKPALGFNLIHQDASKIQAILDVLPKSVLSDQYQVDSITEYDLGGYSASGLIGFNKESDRESLFDAIANVEEIIYGFEVGSWIKLYQFNHDENKSCVTDTIYEVVL